MDDSSDHHYYCPCARVAHLTAGHGCDETQLLHMFSYDMITILDEWQRSQAECERAWFKYSTMRIRSSRGFVLSISNDRGTVVGVVVNVCE